MKKWSKNRPRSAIIIGKQLSKSHCQSKGENIINRLTRLLDTDNCYVVDDTKVQHDVNGYFGEAVTKLAKFENIYDDLLSKQSAIAAELEKLRSEGKTRTVKFKQLLANKMANSNIIILFETYGL